MATNSQFKIVSVFTVSRRKNWMKTARGEYGPSDIEPVERKRLRPSEKNRIIFDGFVHFDVAVVGIQTGEDTLVPTEVGGEDDWEEDFFPVMSTKELNYCIDHLHFF